jgi:hypothetical protein
VARDAGSLNWSIMRGRRPWSLVRAALTHVFAIARPTGSSAMCQPAAGSWMALVAFERPESTTGLVQCKPLQRRCRCGVVGPRFGVVGGGASPQPDILWSAVSLTRCHWPWP